LSLYCKLQLLQPQKPTTTTATKMGINNPKISVNELAICFATLQKNAQHGGGRRRRGERRRRRGSAGDANNNLVKKVAIGWQRERARAGSIMDRGV
jgi:hypothetical protein